MTSGPSKHKPHTTIPKPHLHAHS